MKIPIILISTKGKTKEQLLKECKAAWKKFLEIKKKTEQKNEKPLIQWLKDSEQIPEEGESIDEFIKRTGWTLREENYWRKVNGLSLLKSEEEYRKLLGEKKAS